MFSSENIHSIVFTIDTDPGGEEIFYLMHAARAITVVSARIVSENSQGTAAAVRLALENWGTAGTAIKTSAGTVVPVLGGTASSDQLVSRTPKAGTVNSDAAYIAKGEHLVLHYTEQGLGWTAGDRLFYQVDYALGRM